MRCCQQKCAGAAVMWVYWPGSTKKPMCVTDALRSQHVGQTMGYPIPVIMLTLEEMLIEDEVVEAEGVGASDGP